MPIDTAVVGESAGTGRFVVQARHAMAYAAATGDRNPRYFDDTRPGGVVAPPMMGVRLDWPLRPQPGAAVPGLSPDEIRRGVHAGQDMTFHRLVRPGDHLTTSGRVVAVEQRPPGALVTLRYDTVDAAGAAVLTVFYTSIYRGVVAAGPDRRIDAPPPLPEPAGEDRAPLWEAAVPVAPELPHLYTECADIWNPIHTERAAALAAGLPDIILHGTATLALAAREALDREAAGEPERLARLACRFGAMVPVNSTITVRATGDAAAEGGRAVFFTVVTAAGGPAIRDGVALVRR